MKKTFMPRKEGEKLIWLKNFANKLNKYATKYNITVAEIDDLVASALFYDYWFNYTNQYVEYNKKLTQFKTELRDGIDGQATPSVVPTPPVFAAPPPIVQPGIFTRASSLAVIIKKRTNYTEADGLDLGIEGVEEEARSAEPLKPQISVRLIQGGKPEIVWTKGESDGVEIWVDRGTGFVFAAIDTYPNYTDNFPLPAAGQSSIWKYKAIYRIDDEPTGNWSDVVSVAVAG